MRVLQHAEDVECWYAGLTAGIRSWKRNASRFDQDYIYVWRTTLDSERDGDQSRRCGNPWMVTVSADDSEISEENYE